MMYSREVGLLRDFGRVSRGLREVLPKMEDQDRFLIENMLIVPIRGNISEICEKLGFERSEIYRRRIKALERFSVLWRAWEMGQL